MLYLCAAFPAPMLFGLVIDSSCMVSQTSCDRKGACLLYDADDVRYKIQGFASGLKLLSSAVLIVAWYIARGIKDPTSEIAPPVDAKEPENKRMLDDNKCEKESNV